MPRIKTTVRIGGKDYTISSADSEQYVRRVGSYVNRKIGEMSTMLHLSTDNATVATLTAVSIADELIKSQDEIVRLRKMLETERAAKE